MTDLPVTSIKTLIDLTTGGGDMVQCYCGTHVFKYADGSKVEYLDGVRDHRCLYDETQEEEPFADWVDGEIVEKEIDPW